MKQAVCIMIAVLALSACSKEMISVQKPAVDEASIQFDIRLEKDDIQTKAVKTGWESGDVVYVFFEDNFTQYLKMVYNGSSWSYRDKNDGTTFAGLTPVNGKKLTAVFFRITSTPRPLFSAESASPVIMRSLSRMQRAITSPPRPLTYSALQAMCRHWSQS